MNLLGEKAMVYLYALKLCKSSGLMVGLAAIVSSSVVSVSISMILQMRSLARMPDLLEKQMAPALLGIFP